MGFEDWFGGGPRSVGGVAAILVSLLLGAGCSHEGPPVPAFPEERLQEISLAGLDRVFVFGDPAAAPVLLLHELPGLSPQTFHFADRLGSKLRVYVPLLFGEPNSSGEAARAIAQMTFTGRWRFDAGEAPSRPIVAELGELVEAISGLHRGQPIGIVGMCLTGALPIALSGHPAVDALVLAQPSLPLLSWGRAERRRSLGVSEPELLAASARIAAGEVRVLGLRIEGDTISKVDKWPCFAKLWGDRFIDREICAEERDRHGIRNGAHSALTGEWRPKRDPDHPVEVRQREVAGFLSDPAFGETLERSRCRPATELVCPDS